MKKGDLEYLHSKLDDEGFGYTFIHYSDFKDIKDEEFHNLRDKFLDAVKKLKEYINYE